MEYVNGMEVNEIHRPRDASEICEKLCTSPEYELRTSKTQSRTIFDNSTISEKSQKTFIGFLSEKFCDQILIILLIKYLVLYFVTNPFFDNSTMIWHAIVFASVFISLFVAVIIDYLKERQFKCYLMNTKPKQDEAAISSAVPTSLTADERSGNNMSSFDHPAFFYNKKVSILQQKVFQLFFKLLFTCFVISCIVFVIMTLKFFVNIFIIERRQWSLRHFRNILRFFMISLQSFLVCIPECIPLAFKIAMALSVTAIFGVNNLVCQLHSYVTMGSATSIFFNKTGTLTTNKMIVVQAYIHECEYTKDSLRDISQILPSKVINLIAENISLNSSSQSMVTSTGSNEYVKNGNRTECALLEFVDKIGLNYQMIRDSLPKEQLVHAFPFKSDNKLMITVIRIDGGYRLFVKGSSEIVLSKSKFIFGNNDKLMEIRNDLREHILNDVIKPKANAGLRTISLAYCDFVTNKRTDNEIQINVEPYWNDEIRILSDMTFLCVLGIENPIGSDVSDAIKTLQTSGITVRMVTGDDINTARSIASKCGILDANDVALVGTEFNFRIRDKNGIIQQHLFNEVYPTLRVLAGASPMDKFNLVKGIIDSNIKKHGEVVAMVGNGDGDVLALKNADVGCATQFSTYAAKSASDILLADGKMNDIVKALLWGRNVNNGIAAFLQYVLSVKLVSMALTSISVLTSFKVNISFVIYALWNDLLLNILAISQTFLTVHPQKDLLLRKPNGRTKHIISRFMIKNIIGQSIYQLIVLFTLKFFSSYFQSSEVDLNYSDYLIFNALILMTFFNLFNARKLYGERNVFSGIQLNFISCTICIVALLIFYWYYSQLIWILPIKDIILLFVLGIGILLWQQLLCTLPNGRKPSEVNSVV